LLHILGTTKHHASFIKATTRIQQPLLQEAMYFIKIMNSCTGFLMMAGRSYENTATRKCWPGLAIIGDTGSIIQNITKLKPKQVPLGPTSSSRSFTGPGTSGSTGISLVPVPALAGLVPAPESAPVPAPVLGPVLVVGTKPAPP
jgi:hypothetical protein